MGADKAASVGASSAAIWSGGEMLIPTNGGLQLLPGGALAPEELKRGENITSLGQLSDQPLFWTFGNEERVL